jgi:AcrR family transcriptional regulator
MTTQTISRQQSHAAMGSRIVTAARKLLVNRGEVTLRAVARELGMTAPALYRYAASHEDLVRMIAIAIDADVADRIAQAADRQDADDAPARLIAACVEFRQWALDNREEFALVFTNVDIECLKEYEDSCGMVFFGLLFALWQDRQFPVPALDDLDPGLAQILRHPDAPVDLSVLPEDLHGLIWLMQRGWSRLYGTVTLEVFCHVDQRIVSEAHLFRAMIEDQAGPLGLTDDLPRLQDLIDSLIG